MLEIQYCGGSAHHSEIYGVAVDALEAMPDDAAPEDCEEAILKALEPLGLAEDFARYYMVWNGDPAAELEAREEAAWARWSETGSTMPD